jgi:hypothetical protein
LLVVSTVFVILAISPVSHVDFPIILLLLRGPLVTRLKKLCLGFGSLNACVRDHEQIRHCFGLLHDDLLHILDVTDSVMKGVDDLDVLDIRDSIPDIVKIFYVDPEALIMLLPNCLQSLSSRWMLVRALEVTNDLAAPDNAVGR